MPKLVLTGALLAGATGALPQEGGSPWLERTQGWIAEVRARDTSPEDRERAIESLRARTSGSLDDPATREATFFLARYEADRTGPEDRETRRLMALATTLYPEDPRTPGLLRDLAPAQIAAGDEFGGHLSFVHLFRDGIGDAPASVLALAAENAAAVGDPGAAFRWSEGADLDALRPEQRTTLLLARLESGHALGRNDVALEAADELERTTPERLRTHAGALLAAARAAEQVGDLASAISRYEVFVNVHYEDANRPRALLTLGRLLSRTGRPERAGRALAWLVEDHPEDVHAISARLDLLELGGKTAAAEQLEEYVAVARTAAEGSGAKLACDRIVERFLGAGLPLETVSALAHLAREDDGLAALAAVAALRRGIGPALRMLIKRGNAPSLVAAALAAESAGVPVPPSERDAVFAARTKLGLAPAVGPLARAVEDARVLLRRGEWSEVAARIEDARLLERDPDPRLVAEAELLLASASWWSGQGPEALSRLTAALAHDEVDGPERRALLVLRADVLLSSGRIPLACADYRRAADIERTTWVDERVARCRAAETIDPGTGGA